MGNINEIIISNYIKNYNIPINDYNGSNINIKTQHNIIEDIFKKFNTIITIKNNNIIYNLLNNNEILFESSYKFLNFHINFFEHFDTEQYFFNFNNRKELDLFNKYLIDNNILDIKIYTTLKYSESELILQKLDTIISLLNKNGIS